MNRHCARTVAIALTLALIVGLTASASTVFDPRYQPIGYASAYTLSKPGLASGDAVAFRPEFNSERWSGDVTERKVSAAGVISSSYDWSAAQALAARDYTTRLIFTRLDAASNGLPAGSPVSFAKLGDLSANQQKLLGTQSVLDFVRGDRSGEGTLYRQRNGVLGDIIHSNAVYVDYPPNGLDDNDRLYVGANDGMLHAFNAKTGAEVFAYIPSTVFPTLPLLAQTSYNSAHRYLVDGAIAVADVVLPNDGQTHKLLVGGLGAGGQGYYALDITSPTASNAAQATAKLLWEVNDRSASAVDPSQQKFNELGFSYAQPVITTVAGSGAPRPAVIVGNGYVSTFPDGSVGSGDAFLMILDAATGKMIRAIATGSGDSKSPNGLSSPQAVDVNGDGIVDFVYAGDLKGNLWRFDLRGADATAWSVSFAGKPLFTAANQQGQSQSITVQPAVVPHPDGGAVVLFGTGRMLDDEDQAGPASQQIQTLYGIRDRFDDQPADPTTLIVQELTEHSYTDPNNASAPAVRVRSSSNVVVPASAGGWLVDLDSGERVITPLQVRSGRVIFTTTNPTVDDQANWLVELNDLTGGVPDVIVFDMNKDGRRDANDNVDANGDGDRLDLIDRVTGIYQGTGVVSGATLGVLSADQGTFFINQQVLVQPVSEADKGVLGGHFDVDTSSFISPIDTGTTDGHVHQYDDKYDVVTIDYFKLLEAQLHDINVDVSNPDQRFKLLVVNAALSPGGRLSINKTYSASDTSTYTPVTDYANVPISNLPVYTLSGVSGTTRLTQASMSFDRSVILNNGLVPTETGCVRSNKLGYHGEWRNGALTVWAVAVGNDGSDQFTLQYRSGDNAIVGITRGLLWETTVFWHWKGPCYNQDLQATMKADDGSTTTVYDYYKNKTITEGNKAPGGPGAGKRKKGGKENVGTNVEPLPPKDPSALVPFEQRVESLSNPNRVSWKELFE